MEVLIQCVGLALYKFWGYDVGVKGVGLVTMSFGVNDGPHYLFCLCENFTLPKI